MEKIPDKTDLEKALGYIEQTTLGSPVILEQVPTSSGEVKANTIAKVKDNNEFVYIRFADGALVKVAIHSVI